MNVLLCNDLRDKGARQKFGFGLMRGLTVTPSKDRERMRRDINVDSGLADLLEKQNHQVFVYDCYEDDLVTQIRVPSIAAKALCFHICEKAIEVVLFDLHYFDDPRVSLKYGYDMLEWLRENCGKVHETKFVAASRYIGENPLLTEDKLLNEFAFVKRCVNRFTTPAKGLVKIIEEI